MEFVNETVYNRVTLDALSRISGYTVKRQKNLRNRLLCFVIALVGLGLGFIYDLGNPTLTTISQVYGMFFLFIAMFFPYLQLFPNLVYARKPETRRLGFYEDGFGPTTEGSIRFAYGELQDIVDSKDWIALFWDAQHGVILDKEGFLAGNPEDLLSFLAEKTDLHLIRL